MMIRLFLVLTFCLSQNLMAADLGELMNREGANTTMAFSAKSNVSAEDLVKYDLDFGNDKSVADNMITILELSCRQMQKSFNLPEVKYAHCVSNPQHSKVYFLEVKKADSSQKVSVLELIHEGYDDLGACIFRVPEGNPLDVEAECYPN